MISVGYIYKKVAPATNWDDRSRDGIKDIYAVSDCISRKFTDDYIKYWKHNNFWFFDTPVPMEEIAANESIDLSEMTLFYYEIYEEEYNDDTHTWESIQVEELIAQLSDVILPKEKRLEGFDVVCFFKPISIECSPLSCNGLDSTIPVNQHCLIDSFDEAKNALESGLFTNSEPGPYRIFAVYTVPHHATT